MKPGDLVFIQTNRNSPFGGVIALTLAREPYTSAVANAGGIQPCAELKSREVAMVVATCEHDFSRWYLLVGRGGLGWTRSQALRKA